MFREALQRVVDHVDGALAGVLMGYDGIAVDQYVRDGDGAIDTVGMELSVILKDIRRAAEMLDAGHANEVSVRAERLTTVIRLLNDEYFVAIALRPGGNSGKARYLLRREAPTLLEALS